MTQEDPRREEAESSLSALYRTTRKELPPDSLDAALLAQARRQVAARRRRWMLPLSSAAVVLLGVSLILKTSLLAPPGYPPMPTSSEELGSDQMERLPEAAVPAPATSPARERAAMPRGEEKRGAAVNLQNAVPARPATTADEQAADREAQIPPVRAKAEADGMASQPGALSWRDNEERWVAAMLGLLQEGRVEQAREELALFRLRHPGYTLPDALQRLATQRE